MTGSTHSVQREEVMAYLDGELAPRRATAVAAHLEECGECRILAAELRGVSQQLLAWEVEPVPGQLSERISAAAAVGQPSQRKSLRLGRLAPSWGWWPRRWGIVGLGIVAAVVLMIVAFGTPNLLRNKYSAWMAAQTAREGAESGTARSQFGPMIVRTAEVTLVTKEIDAARTSIERIVAQHQGYIAKLAGEGQTGAGRTLTATLRVPANQFDVTLAELKKLGQVVQESQKGEEVTAQYVDLQARLANARHTEKRLIELLAQRTGKLSDVLDVEKELASVRGEIERMDAQRKTMENQVQFATVEVKVSEEYKAQLGLAPYSAGTRLRNALLEGWHAAVEGALAVAVFLLNYGPSLLFWALIFFWPARWVWRRWRAGRAGVDPAGPSSPVSGT
jgi:anti-sigma factor RsiW